MAFGEIVQELIDSDPRTKSGKLQTPPQQDRSAWQYDLVDFEIAIRNIGNWLISDFDLRPILQYRRDWGHDMIGLEAICKFTTMPNYWDEDYRVGEGGLFGSGIGPGGKRFLDIKKLIDLDRAPKERRLTNTGRYRKSKNTVTFDHPELPPFLPGTTIVESLDPLRLAARYRVDYVTLQPLPLYLPYDHHTPVDEMPTHLLATVQLSDLVDLLDSPALPTSQAKLHQRRVSLDARLAKLQSEMDEINRERAQLSDDDILRIQKRNNELKEAAEQLPKLF